MLRLVVVPRVLLLLAHARCRPLPFTLGAPRQLAPLRLVHGVRLFGMGAVGRPLGEIPGPPASVHPRPPRVLLDLEDIGHRPVEERAVVRHDHRAAPPPRHHLLQPRQTVEVQIVRRLVQQRDVEARQENRPQRHPRLLPARQRTAAPLRHPRRQPHLLEHARQSRLEVGGAERLVTRQCRRVVVLRLGPPLSEGGRRPGHVRLGRGGTGPPVQRVTHRLARVVIVLLAQVAHCRRRWVDADRTAVRRLEQAREELQQRRLADAVGADDTEAGLGPDGQRHAVEDRLATASKRSWRVVRVAVTSEVDGDVRRKGDEAGMTELRVRKRDKDENDECARRR